MERAVTLVDLDRMFNAIDHIYSEFSRTCGLSDCAYWMLVDTDKAGGCVAVSRLTSEWYYSKQTINSSIKRLCEQGILEKTAGPGRTTTINLTATGRALVAEKVRPVIEAETAAMHAFSPAELAQALDLLERYRNALANALAEKGMV